MSITEIKTVVDRLPLGEQEALLHHPEAKMRARSNDLPVSIREEWMHRLDVLRASMGPGPAGPSTDEILDELREE